MFSFHKPKIYRSNLGCCICKAKSSSSRFTDSKRYENEFEQCFRLKEKRSGEICNACVLLVKRWKKLTPEKGLTKHWHHVVDARAGPGTKLSGNRRLTSPATQQRSSSNSSSTNGNPNESGDSSGNAAKARTASRSNNPVPPLSLNNNQANSSNQQQQQASILSRNNRSLSKVCAIDTNISTFTFGEPIVNLNRTRSYMSSNNESTYQGSTSQPTMFASSSATSLKPQSALNSSVFESVIKRFRQRQQQQHHEAQRRQLTRQQRAQQKRAKNYQSACANDDVDQLLTSDKLCGQTNQSEHLAGKRTQRYPSTENALGIASVLDSSIWRREKICCGVIFRGLYNEVAIVPRLLKPCNYRLDTFGKTERKDELEEPMNSDDLTENDHELLNGAEDEEDELQERPPRAAKSGSVSSCDSNTSGCGSMDEVNNGRLTLTSSKTSTRLQRSATSKINEEQQQLEVTSKQVNVPSPSQSSSGNSSSQLASSYYVDEDDGMVLETDLALDGEASL